MTRIALVAIALVVSAQTAQASDPLASRKEAATAMLAACHQRDQVEAYFDKLAETEAQQARANYSQFSDAQWQTFTAAFHENLRGYIDRYMDMTATIDAQHFTIEDMGVLADFCRSAIGQRVSALRAQMERETFELRGAWLQNAVTAAGTDALRKIQPEAPGGGL